MIKSLAANTRFLYFISLLKIEVEKSSLIWNQVVFCAERRMDKTGNSTSPLQNNVSMYLAENSSRIDDLEKNLDTFFIIIMAIIISCKYKVDI